MVKGAVDAVNRNEDIKVIWLEGQMPLRKNYQSIHYPKEQIEIVDATEVIETAEPPVNAIKKEKDSSMVVGMNLVKDKEADAFVSAGNSGAVLVGGQVDCR